MKVSNKRAPRYTTPIGVARWAHLNEPDEYEGKKQFKTELLLTAEQAAAITQTEAFGYAIEAAKRETVAAGAQAKKAGKKPKPLLYQEPFFNVVDKETGEETGEIAFKFRSNATWTDKNGTVQERMIPFFTATGEAIPEADKPRVYGGSRIRVSYSLHAYHIAATGMYGVSLRLEAVKIIELREGGANAAAFGFGEDESEAEESPAETELVTADDGSADF